MRRLLAPVRSAAGRGRQLYARTPAAGPAGADRGGREVNQLRVPVELLRARIAATHTSPAPGAAGESRYRSAAYDSLLTAAGTSYAELRLARGAPPEVRRALAARLGMQAQALPGVDLAVLAAKDGQGIDISADLAAVGLTRDLSKQRPDPVARGDLLGGADAAGPAPADGRGLPGGARLVLGRLPVRPRLAGVQL